MSDGVMGDRLREAPPWPSARLTTGQRAAMRAETFREAAQIVRDCAVQGLGLEAALRALLREAEPR